MPIPNSNRSPSPLSSRTSPHSRNSESSSTTARRSFSGNPFPKPSSLTNLRGLNPPTPVNSPSGFGRRLSGGKEAEKENDLNTKTVKSWSGSNGSKNFMAPTISAACKLSPSPRKKVLMDRNEPIRTSILLSEGKVSFFSSNDEDILVPKSESSIDQKFCETHLESNANDFLGRPSGSKSSKRVTFSDSTLNSREFGGEPVQFDSDCVVTEMNSKDNSFCDSSISPVIAPLDADPSLHPYDPRTNYLSPRPQFLHYKPNPRIEVLLNKDKGTDDGGVKRLEDSFACFENSDTDGMEESSNGDDSQKDSEDSFGAETEPLIVKEEDLSGSEPLVSDSSNVFEDFSQKVIQEGSHGSESINCGESINSEKVVQGKEKEKKGLVARLRSFCVLVLLLLSCCSMIVSYSPSTNSAKILEVFNTSQLHQPAALVDLAKANLNLFTQRFKRFSIESVSHFALLINNLGHGDKLTTLQFMNLTELKNDILAGGHLAFPQGIEIYPENTEWNDLEEDKGDEPAEFSEDETFEDSVFEITGDSEKEIEADLVVSEALPLSPAASVVVDEAICNQEEPAAKLVTESPYDIKPEHYVPLAPEVYEVITESNPENYGGGVNFGENVELLSEDMNLISPSDAIHSAINELPSDAKPSFLGSSRPKQSDFYLLGAASILSALVAIAFATFIKKKRGSGSEQNLGVDSKELLTTKTTLAKSAVEQLYQGKVCSNNWPTEDDVGESCPSEMSSFRRSSSQSHNTMLRTANEAQSGERRARKYSKRESFSSSDISLGGASPSYGSFTSYERIPIKSAAGDDDVVTPVRRSSRLIRSHVTS